MSSRFDRAYRADGNTRFDAAFWNRIMRDLDTRIVGIEEKKASFEDAEKTLLDLGLRRINETLLPAAEKIFRVAELGFLVASSDEEATFVEGQNASLTIREGDQRDLFTPSPFIALTRRSTTDDYAIARTIAYDPETGILLFEVETVVGNGGPHSDWDVAALAGSVAAMVASLDETRALRQAVADDKSDTGTARDVAVAAVGAAQDARDAAILAAGAAEGALDDLRIAVAPPVTSPTAPVLGQIWYDGTTMRVFDGDDFVLVAPWNALTAVSYEVQSLSAPQRAQARANTDSTNAGLFIKASPDLPAFIKTGAATLSVKAATLVEVDGNLITFATDTAITMPALSAGADVAIWVQPDGQIVATLNHIAPPVAGARKIGGAHYAPGGNAAAFNSGGNTTPQFNEHSIWDLKFRPACPDPRGMTLVAGKFWVDIYLCGVNHHSDGTSKYNVTIADGGSPPKVPPMFGGNGSTAYSTMNWWEAAEVMMSHGKELLSYEEFAAAMFGTKEAQSGGTDPVSTILRADYTSKWGVHLATGNMWVWSREFSYRTDATGWAWGAVTGGRGSVYKQGTYGLVAAPLGGDWGNAARAGSRASDWYSYPWDSASTLGARGRCDHLSHV